MGMGARQICRMFPLTEVALVYALPQAMKWRPDPQQTASWSTVGGVMTIVGTGAVLTLALAPSAHISLLLIFACGAIAVLGAYLMVAPLLGWWPWADGLPRSSRFGLALIGTVALIVVAVKHGGHASLKHSLRTSASAGNVDAAGSQAPSSSSGATYLPGVSAYNGVRFSAEIPIGWYVHENEMEQSGEIESTWHDSVDENDLIVIDLKPAGNDSPREYAEPVHRKLLSEPGYDETYYGPGDLHGFDSWMWIFRVSEHESIDYFFTRCSTTFAVLGSATVSRFSTLRATFRATAQSVRARCH
jgi:hypothetical protein